MRKRPTDTQGVCDALNALGIKTSIPGGVALENNLLYRALRDTEKAHWRANMEINRISGNAKQFTSR